MNTNHRHNLIHRLILLSVIVFTSFSNPASSKGIKELQTPRKQVFYFDVPRQTLVQGIIEFAIQSNVTVIVNSTAIEEYPSNAIVGFFTSEDALERLLIKSPMNFAYVEKNNSYVLTQKKANHLNISEGGLDIAAPTFEEVIVSGTHFPQRYHSITSSLVHGNLSSFDTARFITVLPSGLLRDQSTETLTEILRNTSGITPGDGFADSNDDFFIRGFPRNSIYIDGFRLENSTGTKVSPTNIEKIEILKGPSTLRYGQAEPGGVVNIVRKKPLSQPHTKLELSSGSGDKNLVSIDIARSTLPNDSPLDFRLIYTHLQQEKLQDITEKQQDLVAPTVRWQANNSTQINIGGEYQKTSQVRDQGTVLFAPEGESLSIITIDSPASQAQPEFESEFKLFNIDIRHNLSDSWYINASYFKQSEKRQGVRASLSSLTTTNVVIDRDDFSPDNTSIFVNGILIPTPFGTSLESDNEQPFSLATLQSLYDEKAKSNSDLVKILIQGSSSFWGLNHHISAGADAYHQKLFEEFTLEKRFDIQSLTLDGQNTTNPLSQIESSLAFKDGNGELSTRSQNLEYTDYGLYIQDSVEISSELITSFGARYTIASGRYKNSNTETYTDLETFKELSTDLGTVYHVSDNASLYFNYSQTVMANYQIDDFETEIKEPETSEQLEVGVKFLALDNRLIATAAIYKINKSNIVDISFTDNQRRATVGGEQSSRGIDVDFNYQPFSSTSLIGALSHVNALITKGEYEGKTPVLASSNTASLFINHTLSGESFNELNINFGAYYIGKRYGDSDNNFEIKGYTVLELGSSYGFSVFGSDTLLKVSIKNLLDEDYISSSEGAIRVNHGAGRTFTVLLNITL